MKFLKICRTLREGVKNFTRNGGLALATVSVMVLSLYIMSVTVVMGVAGRGALEDVEDQLSISVYFHADVEASRVEEIGQELREYQEIEKVVYVSKEEALDILLEGEGQNDSVMRALDEIGENPLLAYLIVTARHPEQYEGINTMLLASAYAEDIDFINYDRNRVYIANLQELLSIAQKVGLATGAVFLFISILITYNAIRLTLYSQRKEFEIMRLVGASNLYIKLPTIFEGVLYGLVASLVTLILLFLTVQYVVPIVDGTLGDAIVSQSVKSFWWVPLIVIPSLGIALGMVSSWVAIRRYLNI